MSDNENVNTETKTERGYVCHLTSGDRRHSRTDVCFAESPESAKRLSEQLNPGWRCYGVQLGFDDDHPKGG